MSETERALCRAQGSFDNFIASMKEEMERRGRSKEYQEQFWDALKDYAADWIVGGK